MTVKTIARFGVLTSLALMLGYFERFIPIAPGLPGVKLGLANSILLYAIYLIDSKSAFTLMILKVVLSAALYAGLGAIMFSFSGGLFSLIMMLLTKRYGKTSVIGVSVIGAVFHNIGQLVVAGFIVQTRGLLFYLPILLISGVITGIITGTIAKNIIRRFMVEDLNTV